MDLSFVIVVVLSIVGLVCVDISLARFVDLGSGSYLFCVLSNLIWLFQEEMPYVSCQLIIWNRNQ